MKKIILLAAVLLMLSCSCRDGMESKAYAKLPWPAATPSERGTDGAQITLHVSRVIDGGELRELLDESVVAGHATDVFREQELDLFVGELADDVQDFPEEAALLGLRCGLRVLVRLGEATHVANAVPRGTDDGADFSTKSTEDSLLDFTHDN